ncbi:hypothetical protein K443DRAFT_540745 [Laccaria amethystina LaAM-08-1]|uniref:Uncharacterized protein n=1 Tax=Laccaria amethystina LaAM-08-1 TaxID=1095629 RepID=A0A0C9WRP4_9AGAR|nr:hypothetical protein K443DRAFT_540745 [Laccaria amethystina LaAM-08-1]
MMAVVEENVDVDQTVVDLRLSSSPPLDHLRGLLVLRSVGRSVVLPSTLLPAKPTFIPHCHPLRKTNNARKS